MSSGLEEITLSGVLAIPLGHRVTLTWVTNPIIRWGDLAQYSGDVPLPHIVDTTTGIAYPHYSHQPSAKVRRTLRGIVRSCTIHNSPSAEVTSTRLVIEPETEPGPYR
jgi:hypothetical protein